jgi:hypothetical protein
MRKCKSCGDIKPLDDFPPYSAKGIQGRRGTCRACWNLKWSPVIAAHNARYYHENHAGMRDSQKARTRAQHKAPGGAEKHRASNTAYAAKHPERKAAKVAVAMAVRAGRLLPQLCSVCGDKAQAHHDDYSRPLEVIWLCPFHHGERHRLLRRYGPTAEWPEDLRVQEFPT